MAFTVKLLLIFGQHFIEISLSSFLSAKKYILADGHMTKMAATPIYSKTPSKNIACHFYVS